MTITISDPAAPKELWKHFESFNKIPRPSAHEEKIRQFIIALSADYQCRHQVDKEGNLVVYVPASKGREKDATIIVQNHLDMVTDAVPGHQIDFEKDPIETYVDGDWVKAKGTTLGADNGIGCAAALALMTDKNVSHPPLELLFTVEEETGLGGAVNLDPKMLSGKKLLNLDTEEWGSVYVGCAGGGTFEFQGDVVFENLDSSYLGFELILKNFNGGHSGLDIHRGRANAIKKAFDLLSFFSEKMRLMEVKAGKAHNIIPRDIWVKFALPKAQKETAIRTIQAEIERWRAYLNDEDQNFTFELAEFDVDQNSKALSLKNSQKMTALVQLFPHGPHNFIKDSEVHSFDDALVQVSNNLAIMHIKNNKVYVLSSLRFFNREESMILERTFHALAQNFSLEIKKLSGYPSWEPNFAYPLLEELKKSYSALFQQMPKVKAIHAGLECGILTDMMPNVQAVSFGPTITGAHSPDEKVEISSVTKFWQLLVKFLEK